MCSSGSIGAPVPTRDPFRADPFRSDPGSVSVRELVSRADRRIDPLSGPGGGRKAMPASSGVLAFLVAFAVAARQHNAGERCVECLDGGARPLVDHEVRVHKSNVRRCGERRSPGADSSVPQ